MKQKWSIKKILLLLILFSQFGYSWGKGVNEYSIYSHKLAQKFEYRVWLPDNYQSNKIDRYPLLFILDGQKYGQIVAQNAQFLASSGDIPEQIIVALSVTNRLKHYTPTDSADWEGDGGAQKFQYFIDNELFPLLTKRYRMSELRLLWGHSAAGLFTMYAFLQNTPNFNVFLVNDGSLYWDNHYVEKQLKQKLKQTKSAKKFLYINNSFLDENTPKKFQYMPGIIESLTQANNQWLDWQYHPMPNESHASIPLIGSIDGLRAFYTGYKIPESVIFKGIDAVKRYFNQYKNQLGSRQKIPEQVIVETGLIAKQTDLQEAIKAFNYCTELYPLSIQAYELLSETYFELGQVSLAKKALQQAINNAKKTQPNEVQRLLNDFAKSYNK